MRKPWLAALLLLLAAGVGQAETAVAVLDFELNDLTLDPATAEELARTASLRPLLEAALAQRGEYRLVAVTGGRQREADRGFGYLFEHPGAAAALAAERGADFVLVGRLHKPSFLFAYLQARLVSVGAGRVVGYYVVEVKGSEPALTERGIEALAADIAATLQASVGGSGCSAGGPAVGAGQGE
jgi:hypothetical protein